MITAIIPVDLARRPASLLMRLRLLMRRAARQNLHIVIGHNDRGGIADHALKALCRRHRATLASAAYYGGDVNTAYLRNQAIVHVKTPLTLLLDADIYLDDAVLQRAARSVLDGESAFRVLPCLYLSKQGSSGMLRGRTHSDALLNDYLRFRRAPFLHMAIPSSVTIFRTEDYARAGAFDSEFTGHGYEDLDFLVRLGWLHEQIPVSRELLIDAPARAPLLASGFRGQLARLALPSLLQGDVAFHLWHSTKRDHYYEARSRNARRFREKIAAHLNLRDEPANGARMPSIDLSLIRAWSEMCRRFGVDVTDYSILFDNRPGQTDRLDTPIRRLKFLLGSY